MTFTKQPACLAFTVLLAFAGPPATAQTASRPRAASASRPAPSLTNQDIMKMLKAGLGEPIIVATIRSSQKRAFSLTPDSMIELKAAGVSDAVIALMLDPTAPAPAPTVAAPLPAPTPDPNDPATPRESGIYLHRANETPRLTMLQPSTFSGAKMGGGLMTAMTMGMKKMKMKAIVRAPGAGLRFKSAEPPAFYFYFDPKSGGLSAASGATSSPAEYVLARFEQKKDSRELVVLEMGGLRGPDAGLRSKDLLEFKVEQLSSGIYRVVPTSPLEPGEYCFFPSAAAGNAAAGSFSGRLYDFGVDPS
jgi:hypothetical protein